MGLPHHHLKKKHDLANPQAWISNSCRWDTNTPLSAPRRLPPQTMTQPTYSLAAVRRLIGHADSLCGNPGSRVSLTLGVWFRTVVGKSKFPFTSGLWQPRCPGRGVGFVYFSQVSPQFHCQSAGWHLVVLPFPDQLRDTRFVHSLLLVYSHIHLMCEMGFRFPALFISKEYVKQADVLERRWKQTQCTLNWGEAFIADLKKRLKTARRTDLVATLWIVHRANRARVAQKQSCLPSALGLRIYV